MICGSRRRRPLRMARAQGPGHTFGFIETHFLGVHLFDECLLCRGQCSIGQEHGLDSFQRNWTIVGSNAFQTFLHAGHPKDGENGRFFVTRPTRQGLFAIGTPGPRVTMLQRSAVFFLGQLGPPNFAGMF